MLKGLIKKIKFKMNQKILFTSDHYFGLTNIIRRSERLFALVKQTNWELTKRRNKKVNLRDIVYHFG